MKIKICGLRSSEDVRAVNEAKPDYAGFVAEFPKSRRSVSESELRVLRKELAADIRAVGVFVDADPALIVRLFENGVIDVAQLHGSEDETYVENLRSAAPGLLIWRAFQVRSARDVLEAQSSKADMTLLDAGQGGGEAFDWSFLEDARRPYVLAGGLDPGRIREAAALPGVACVDLSSGVETDGRKDPRKIMEAVAAAREV